MLEPLESTLLSCNSSRAQGALSVILAITPSTNESINQSTFGSWFLVIGAWVFWRSSRRLSSPILPRLGALVRHLGAKMPQHLPRYPKKHHLGANIVQHSPQNAPKTASRTFQRRPHSPKNHPKCRSVVRFYTSAIFLKIAPKTT